MRFSLSDMLWTVGLLAMSFAGISVFVKYAASLAAAPRQPDLLPVLSLCSAPVSFFAAIGALFRCKALGAVLGLAVAFVLAILLAPGMLLGMPGI